MLLGFRYEKVISIVMITKQSWGYCFIHIYVYNKISYIIMFIIKYSLDMLLCHHYDAAFYVP